MSVKDDLEDDLDLEKDLEEDSLEKSKDELELETEEKLDELEHSTEIKESESVAEIEAEKEESEQELPQTENTANEDDEEIVTHDEEDDCDMDVLRAQALKSLGTNKPRKNEDRDSQGSRSPSRSDSENEGDLENMRRMLLAQRAANKPGDLRSRLSTKKVKPVEPLNEKFYINPSPLKKVANLQFTIKRVSPPIQKKIENNIQNANLSFNITRTVKNEQARNPNSLIIDTRDSSEEEENQNQVKVIPKIVQSLHSKQTAKKRRSSRAVFQSVSDIVVEDESLDEISDSEDTADEILIVKEIRKPKKKKSKQTEKIVAKRSPERKVHSRSAIEKIESRKKYIKNEMPTKVRNPSKTDSPKKAKVRKTGDDEFDKKMDRIRRENERLEQKAKLVQAEKRKYGYK